MNADPRDLGAAAPQRRMCALPDGELSYLDWGGPPKAPRVVMSNANGFNAQTYRQLLTPLAGRLRIQAVDARGHGFSTATADPQAPLSWNVFRHDLIRFLESGDRPSLLVGHSLGATTSLLLAELRPDLVSGVLAVEPVLQPFLKSWVMRAKRWMNIPHQANGLVEGAMKRRAVFADREAIFKSYNGRGAFASWPEAVLRDYITGGTRDRADGQVELSCAPTWEAHIFRSSGTYIWDRLARIRVPITIIHGNVNSTCSLPVTRRMARLHPSAKIFPVDGASHFLPMESPDIVRENILRMSGL
ncbi:MAG: alpha/beta hydrolase [Alphaproteobacteria bacterium]|nr:alpha/beta hydrolase [Alphaproteobacteria bacterium]